MQMNRLAQWTGWALVAALGATLGNAHDWPQWRGPNRDGVSTETGLLKSWPAAGPRLAWRATGLGAGYVTVAIAQGRVFTAGERDDTAYVLALSEADGKAQWSNRLGKAGAPGWGGFAGPRGVPTIDGSALYAVGQYGELVCLDTATGKEIWRKHLVDDFGGRMPEWGFSESPLVVGDQVMVTPGSEKGTIVALDKKTGALRWQSQGFTDEPQYASIVAASIGGTPQLIQLTMASLAAVSPQDGRLLWRAARKGSTAVISTPVVSGNLVYVSSGYNIGCHAFEITSEADGLKARQLYASKAIMNHHGGVILVDGHVYGHSDNKGWTCQELKTGKVIWQEKDRFGKGSLVYADGHFYLREEDEGKSRVALIEATTKGYVQTGLFSQPDPSGKQAWPHPVVANGKLYLRDQDLLLVYDVRSK